LADGAEAATAFASFSSVRKLFAACQTANFPAPRSFGTADTFGSNMATAIVLCSNCMKIAAAQALSAQELLSRQK
jgi:hypothetical protein